MKVSRRDFVRAGAAVGAGLTVSAVLGGCVRDAPPTGGGAAFAPNAWIRIGTDDVVTVIVDRVEMGQGVATALPMLVAEELDADWATIRYQFAPVNAAYDNPLSTGQLTGGSTSMRAAWRPLREAAARARFVLVAAAARRFGVAASSCLTQDGAVVAPDGRSLRYGSLAREAAALPLPARVALKPAREFRLIGRAIPRLDAPDKVSGRAVFGIDAGPPGALTAVIARCPVFGGKLRSFDPAAAGAVPGVRMVFAVPSGVAVVAEGYAAARKGRDRLSVSWDEGEFAAMDDAAVAGRLASLGSGAGRLAFREGEGAAALAGAGRRIEAAYEAPFLAHATMEPMNCTALVRRDTVTLWVPGQFLSAPRLLGGGAREIAARVAGVPMANVTVHATLLGGGFGRRLENDFVAEACEVSRRAGAPVRLVWSREDDIRHDAYRPAARHLLRAGLDRAGRPVAWTHHVVSPSIIRKYLPSWVPDPLLRLGGPLKGGVDQNAVEGAVDLPYAIPHREVRYSEADLGVPVGFWRSVGHSHTAFAVECFIDELARVAGSDPVEYRRNLLERQPRHRGVLDLAARQADWGSALPAGRARGVAVHASFGSFVAQVAEVSVEAGAVRVHRVVCAVDCGQVVNPDIVAAQMESGIVFGLSAALHGKISLEKGRVKQSNFHDYRILTMREMPVVEVHLVPGSWEPGGVGEPGTPPIAPAVANAVSALTGTPVRSLPIAL